MKKIFLINAIIIASANVFAQDAETGKPKNDDQWSGRTFTPFVSLGGAKTNIKDKSLFSGTEAALMVAAGCQFGYVLNPHIGLYTGISFAQYNWTASYQARDVADQCKNKTNYIQIPFTVRGVTSKANKIGFFAEAGANIGILASVEQKVTYFGVRPAVKSTDKQAFTKTMFSAYFFYGVKIPLSNKARLFTGLDHYVFLQDQFNDTKSKLATAGLRIGVEVKM